MVDRINPREMTIPVSVEALLWLEWKSASENAATTPAERATGVWSNPEDYAAALIEQAYLKAVETGDVPADLPQRLKDWDDIPF